MRPDIDLTFLQHSTNDDLRVLCDILTKGKDGEYRFCEQRKVIQAHEYNPYSLPTYAVYSVVLI